MPRTSLTPILRFADIEAFVQEERRTAGAGLAAMLQLGVAKEQQPHYMRVLTLPEHDPSDAHPLRPRGHRQARAGGERRAPDRTATSTA